MINDRLRWLRRRIEVKRDEIRDSEKEIAERLTQIAELERERHEMLGTLNALGIPAHEPDHSSAEFPAPFLAGDEGSGQ